MKKNSLIAYVLTFILIIGSMPIIASGADSNIEIYSYLVSDGLHSKDSIVTYEGTTKEIEYNNSPTQDKKYLLVDVKVQNASSSQAINLGNINLEIDGTTFNRISDSFISNHGYTPLPQYEVGYGDFYGMLTYEIPKNISLDSANIVLNNISFNINNSSAKIDLKVTNIPTYEDKLSAQTRINKELYSLLHSDNYTLDNPFVMQNPYGAYLTAITLFKTETDSKVTIEISGKDEYSTVSYDFEGFRKYHSIPILGLYANYKNTVKFTVTDLQGVVTTKTIEINTDVLPNRVPTYKLIESKPEKMENGMTFLAHSEDRSGYTAIDNNAEIRWYMDAHTTNAPFTRLKNGNMLVVSNADEYPSTSKLYEMDMLGRIIKVYNINETIHHDATEDADGNLVVAVEQGYRVIDRNTGEVIETLDLKKILPSSLETDFYNKYKNYDHLHLNTTAPFDNYMVMSLRNQDMVLKIERDTKQIDWIIAYPENIPSDMQKYMLTPIGDVTYLGGQHDSQIIEDLDGNSNTTELIVYDNHIEVLRGNDTSGDYSRGVIYQIDEAKRTIKELWSYGEELGDFYHCSWQGSANYYPASKTSLMLFNTTSNSAYGVPRKTYSSAIETTMDNEVVFHADAYGEVDMPTYRAERYTLYPNNNWNLNLSTQALSYGEAEKLNTAITEITDGNSLGYLPENTINIKEIGVNDNRLIFRGSGNTKNTEVIFFGEKTYSAKGYNIYGNNIEINADYNSLPDGRYSIGLLSTDTSGKKYYASTKYYINKGGVNTFNEFEQKQIDSIMAKEFDANLTNNTYSITSPLIYLDPYNVSPLTAVGMFRTTYAPAKLTVTVKGKTDDTNISYEFGTFETIHKFPIYGLYADYNNTVELKVTYEDGKTESYEIKIQTEKTPDDLYNISVETMEVSNMNNDLYFIEGNQNMAFDKNGDVRWYFSNELQANVDGTPIRQLSNGNIAMFSEKIAKQPYYASSFYELNYLGKIIHEYTVTHGHHEIEELPNGNFLVATKNPNRDTEEDYIEEIDRETGVTVKVVDLYEIIKDPKISNEAYQAESTPEASKSDWFHLNSFDYIKEDNSIVVSGRNQNFVGKINYDTKELIWAFTEPFNGMSEDTKSKLLTPINGTTYVYGQHSVEINEDGNLQIYDNGNHRSKTVENSIATIDNFSRGTAFEVDEENMTIKEVFSYGANTDFQTYTPYIGDIDYLGLNNYLINFGGLVEMNGQVSDNILAAMDGTARSYSRLVEIKDNKVIANITLESDAYSNVYRASKANIYNNQGQLKISNSNNYAAFPGIEKVSTKK